MVKTEWQNCKSKTEATDFFGIIIGIKLSKTLLDPEKPW